MMDYYDPNDHWLHRQSDDMNDDDRMKAAIMQCAVFLILLIVGLALCALLGSCSTTRVVTVEKVRTDTVRVNRTARDSIYLHDSIHIKEKGDTVWIERWHTRWENHLAHDTTYVSKTDSVPVPYPVTEYVEKPRSAFEKGMMATGGLAIMAVIVLLAWKVRRFLP